MKPAAPAPVPRDPQDVPDDHPDEEAQKVKEQKANLRKFLQRRWEIKVEGQLAEMRLVAERFKANRDPADKEPDDRICDPAALHILTPDDLVWKHIVDCMCPPACLRHILCV